MYSNNYAPGYQYPLPPMPYMGFYQGEQRGNSLYPGPPMYFPRRNDTPGNLVHLSNSVTPIKKCSNMDGGLGMPQPSAAMHDSEFNNRCAAPAIGDSNTTLWQFLLELLRDGGYPHLIQWTNREGEFKLLNAEGVAQLWGKRKGKEHMNYDKLSRALRYYYDKNIIKKVIGQKFVYRFVDTNGGNFPMVQGQATSEGLYHPYRQNGMKTLLGHGLPGNLGIDMQNIKKEDPMPFSIPIPTSSALPMTPVQQHATDLAALNLSGVSSTSNDTPSPTDSSCSPNSICSSSGVSSAVPTVASPPGPSSRPGSADAHATAIDNSSRKRKASPPPPIKVEKNEASHRRSRPENLDLASTQYLNPTLPMAVSPMHVMQQMSPFLLNQQMQFYALASASLCGPNSPLFSAIGNANSPFRSPLSTPKQTQVFQFPPISSAATAVSSAIANLMNSPAILSAGFNSNTGVFKFPTNDVLKTPTLPMLSQLTKPVPVNSDS